MEMQLTASESRLRQLKERENRLLQQLRDLDAYLIPTAQTGGGVSTADFQNAVQLRKWVDMRRASVNTELAQVRALTAVAKKDLAHQFARNQAAEKIVKKSRDQAALESKRRGDYSL